ncbi:tetratricopeptide repeat protein [Candidatus Leptofilum sp.]|uniref:tetratricopeptide repeat protein n=1 Tax=Candidatus Leptofilum sp. TaxID=3241576 RepID=UPI003B5AAFFC
MERPISYIPMDRRQALYRGERLPDPARGAALFADVSGFTPLTVRLVQDLGPQRGAEEVSRHLNTVYDGLVDELHRYGGSVISFSGDAVTCWFEGDNGFRATSCALAMQSVMEKIQTVQIPSGEITLAMKTAVVTGSARRFLIGNPRVQLIDVLAGQTLDRLVEAEHEAEKGEVILDEATIQQLGPRVHIKSWRQSPVTGARLGVVKNLENMSIPAYWPTIPQDALDEAVTRRWLLPPVYKRLVEGGGEFLAELRPAVAMFVSFAGIDYDDDEEAETKLDTFIQNVQEILSRYDSNLLQLTIGDKGSTLYAAFGAPFAHEDDAIRAISAGLELQELANRLPYISPLQIGICQGRLRTGAYGGTMRRTYGVLGDAVNTAARLMQTAVPGQILVIDETVEQTGDRFVWEALPPVRVKGKSEPLTVFAVAQREAEPAIRLQEPQYALPMVGRATEQALIQKKMLAAKARQGQVVAISGEAGIGKSRLVAQIIRLASEQQFLGFGAECQSYGTSTSYLVWQRIWQDFFGLTPDMPVEQQIAEVAETLQQINPALLPRMPLLGAVLRLQIPDNELTQSFDAQLRKVSLESLLVECLRARAKETAVFLVLEDCHWLDPLSFELLEAITRAIADRPILIVLAVRAPVIGRIQTAAFRQLPNFTEIKLHEFTPEEAEHLMALKMEQLTRAKIKIPRPLREKITERAAGNPFYIEELLNYLQNQSSIANTTLQDLDLPTSLHSLILSRIDQLTESQRNTIKVASVIGRLFRAAMLWGAYPPLGGPQQVKSDLEVLEQMDLTPQDTPEPELAYLFKNVVTQEVAYESLPFATRAMLHDLIGQYIEGQYAPALQQYVGLLAYHYGRSDNDAKKREYLLKAGEAAQAEYANEAAIEYFQRVLPLLPEPERAAVMRKLGSVLELVGQWDEASDLYSQGLQLAQLHGNQQEEAWCQAAQAELLRKRGRFEEASDYLEAARLTFEQLEDEEGVAQAYHSAGTLAAQQGEYEKARTLYEQSLALRRELEQPGFIAALLSNLAIIARFQGNLTASRRLNEEALEIRRQVGDRRTIANSLNNLGNVVRNLGDLAQARDHLEEALQLQREVGDRWAIANSLNNLGNVVRDQADFTAARQFYVESLTINHEFGDGRAIAYVLEDMAALAAAQNEADRALQLVGAAQTLRQEIGSPLSAVEQSQLDGRLTTVTTHENAESYLERGRQHSLTAAIEFALN